MPFDDACVQTYGQLRAVLAAIGLTHRLTVVTHNTREFGRIDGLKLQDWEE